MRRRWSAAVAAAVLGSALVPCLGSPVSATPAPTVSIGSASVVEGDAPRAPAAKVPLTLSEPQSADTYVTWQMTGGTATAGDDYRAMAKPKTTRIRAGKTAAYASVGLYGDTIAEGDETLTLAIIDVSGGSDSPTIGTADGTVTIVDDDPGSGVSVSLGSTRVVEGGDATTPTAKLAITLSDPQLADTYVTWDVVGGTAGSGDDYRAITKPKTTRIRAGKTAVYASVGLYGDTIAEGNETITLAIIDVSGGSDSPTIGTAEGTVTIVDDDTIPAAGGLWTWGDNGSGQLGLGDTTPRLDPTQVGATTSWVDVATATNHTVAVRADGTLWAWGANANGELGLGDTAPRLNPAQVGTATNWMRVSASAYRTMAIRSDGTLWAWGWNAFGGLGLGDETDRTVPTQVGGASGWVDVAAGFGHTLAVRDDGTLWAWGANWSGQLGIDDEDGSDVVLPTQVGVGTGWARVAAGATHSLAIRDDGTLWAWGANLYGQLGLGDNDDRLAPEQIAGGGWQRLAAGYNHSAAIRADGTLWTWGYNGSGQLGLGDDVARNQPEEAGTATNWRTVAAGANHSLGIRTDGTLWSWGSNWGGQLGQGDVSDRAVPTQVGTGTGWVAAAGGDGDTLAVQWSG